MPEGFAEVDFGLGVLGAVGAHHPRDGLVFRNRRTFVADVHLGQMLSGSGGGWRI